MADDLAALRDMVARELTNLDPAVAQCTKLDAASLATWQTTRTITQHWIDTVTAELGAVLPSGRNGELYDQGIGLEKVLRLNWWPKLTAAGCQPVYPQPSAPRIPGLSTDNPDFPFPIPSLANLEGIVKALVIVLALREVREWSR